MDGETEEERERTRTVRNETTKLTATYTNGLAIAVFAVGGLGPFFTALFSTTPGNAVVALAIVVCFVCQCVSIGLHLVARRFIRNLI